MMEIDTVAYQQYAAANLGKTVRDLIIEAQECPEKGEVLTEILRANADHVDRKFQSERKASPNCKPEGGAE